MSYHIVADTHVHTVFSGHAYSTLTENCRAAQEKQLSFVACTDHTGGIPDAPGSLYFSNLRNLPEELLGVYLLRGCEANVVNRAGSLDLKENYLRNLDWVIASMHTITFPPEDCAAHTEAWLNVAENPQVDVIGHLGDGRFPCDYERVVRAFGERGKIVEINAHSFSARPGSRENCGKIALLCKKYSVSVVVSTDAHFWTEIGEFGPALELLEEVQFPQELVLNADYGRFAAMLSQKTGRTFRSGT